MHGAPREGIIHPYYTSVLRFVKGAALRQVANAFLGGARTKPLCPCISQPPRD